MKRAAPLVLPLFLAGCYSLPTPPEPPYRAIGHGPEWTLVIDDRDLHFFTDGGRTHIVQPKPTPINGFAGPIYQTQRLGVNVARVGCVDPATGVKHPDRVQVDADGRRYEGCGGA